MGQIKVITSFRTLMSLASDVGKAKKKGDAVTLSKAQDKLEAYKQVVLSSSQMDLHLTYKDLS